MNGEMLKPEWLQDFKKRISLIDIIDRTFDLKCDCETCKRLREIAEDLGKMFKLPETPTK